MSILLDALRKSEQGKRPVEPPTIHTDQHIVVDSRLVKKAPLAMLLVLALLLIAWIVWRQYQPSTEGYQPPAALPATPGGAITTPVSSMQPTDPVVDSGRSVKPSAKQPRTPVEQFQQAARDTDKPQTVKLTKVQAQATKPKPQTASPMVSQTRQAAADEAGGNERADVMRPEPISYWELPDSIRADVPEIKFSVLVYASEPADRFVLVNGQRLAQGDSYQQGLVVEEIRRDGVIFSYRLYKFLIQR